MKSRATRRFWRLFEKLPLEIQDLARKNHALWLSDPRHPSLHFKPLAGSEERFSVRIGLHYRAIGWKPEDQIVEWVWIGSHADYSPTQMQDVMYKLDELILALRRV